MDDCSQENTDELFKLLDFVGHKKKKKVSFVLNENFSENKRLENTDNLSIESVDNLCKSSEADLNFDLPLKKKKRKSKTEAPTDSAVDCSPDVVDSLTEPIDSNAEYSYEDLLSLVFSIMREKDPKRDADGTKKLIMKPPQVIRIGTKKSSFVNFLELCKLLHRLPHHVQSFLLVELGTSGSIDGNNQLIIKGRFEQKQIENVLRRYIKEYVSCHTCRSPDTMLQKDTRLFFLQCESCGARCSVASIKAGFQAVTGKRAAMRAKAN